jgi:hypothetical protein
MAAHLSQVTCLPSFGFADFISTGQHMIIMALRKAFSLICPLLLAGTNRLE